MVSFLPESRFNKSSISSIVILTSSAGIFFSENE
jgi:hypothetical protein